MKIAATMMLTLLGVSSQASVLGQIQRFAVQDTTKPAYQVIGQVSEFCTGTLIGPRVVLTAAHCLVDENGDMLPMKDLSFSPARSGLLNRPYGITKAVSSRVHPLYRQIFGGGTSDRHDIGIMILEKSPLPDAKWVQITEAPEIFKSSGTITGYPGDKLGTSMWNVACDFLRTNRRPGMLEYTCDTAGGMSGSALIVAHATLGRAVIGVHTLGSTASNNAGVLLTTSLVDWIRKTSQFLLITSR